MRSSLLLLILVSSGCASTSLPELDEPLRRPQVMRFLPLPEEEVHAEAPFLRVLVRVPKSEGARVVVRVAGEEVGRLGVRCACEASPGDTSAPFEAFELGRGWPSRAGGGELVALYLRQRPLAREGHLLEVRLVSGDPTGARASNGDVALAKVARSELLTSLPGPCEPVEFLQGPDHLGSSTPPLVDSVRRAPPNSWILPSFPLEVGEPTLIARYAGEAEVWLELVPAEG